MKAFTPLESQSCQESVGGAADGILPLHVQRHARCPSVGWGEIQILPLNQQCHQSKKKQHFIGLNETQKFFRLRKFYIPLVVAPFSEVNGTSFQGEISLMNLPSRLCPISIGWQGMERFSRNMSWNEQWPVHPVFAITISHYNKDPHWPTHITECHKVFISLAPMVYQPTNPSSNYMPDCHRNFSTINFHL